MTSTFTTRNRFNKQGDGDGTNVWGDVVNTQVFDMMDVALDGWAYLTPTTNLTLTTANGVADQARCRGLKYQSGSTAVTTTLPALEKLYLVWNASTAAQTIASSGGGTTATIQPGEVIWIACDATNVVRVTLLTMGNQRLQNLANGTAAGDAVNFAQMNAAISSAVFTQTTFGVPIVPGNTGQILTNNGSTPNWETPTVEILADYASDQAAKQAATQAAAVTQSQAFAVCWSLLF